MKKLLYLGIILMLASCGSNECDSLSSEIDKQIRTNTFTSEEVLPDAQERYFKYASNLGESDKLTKKCELLLFVKRELFQHPNIFEYIVYL